MDTKQFSTIYRLKKEGKNCALCTVIETSGSTPRKAGSKMVVEENGTTHGTIGGGSIEKKVTQQAILSIKNRKLVNESFALENDLDMICGGNVQVFIEPMISAPKLFIFGMGHVGSAVAKLASQFGFELYLIDHRPDSFSDFENDNFNKIEAEYLDAIETLPFDNTSFIVVTTPKHAFDENVSSRCAKQEHLYLGVIGSKRKVATMKNNFLKNKVLTEKEIAAIDMPIGIPFHAETPEEIALSIVAKLIDVKNRNLL